MIVDSSAVIAILLREPGYQRLVDLLAAAPQVGIGGPTMVECGLVLVARAGIPGKSLLARFVQEGGLAVLPFTVDHWSLAADAFSRYGKGRHPAALNFGDCLTYATAKAADEPLLCVGDDFRQTDLLLAP